jgi:hypothetical protein
VKNSYASVAEYLGVFEPLLFEEVKAQIVQGRSSEEDGACLSGFASCALLCFCWLIKQLLVCVLCWCE